MAKKTTPVLAAPVREAVSAVIAIRKAKGLDHNRWSQAEHALALAFWASECAFPDDEMIAPAEGKLPPAVKTALASTTAEGQSSDYGFLGNASQFRQALEALAETDPLFLPKTTASDGYE